VPESTTNTQPEPAAAAVAPAVAGAGPLPESGVIGALSPRTLGPQLVYGGLVPFLVYQLGRHKGLADATALAWASCVPAVVVCASWAVRRRLQIIPAISLIGIVLGVVSVTLLHGSELLLKLRESVFTGAFGLVCLATLVLPVRPLMFHIGRAITGSSDRQGVGAYTELWERPEARRVFFVLTAVWGVGLLGEAVLRTVLALELSTGSFIAVAHVLGWAVMGSLLYWTVGYIRRSRRQAEVAAVA